MKRANSLSLSGMGVVTILKHDAPRARRTLGICGGAHCLHDGFTDVIYVLLPIWRDALGLSLVQVGLLKSIASAALAGFQMPASFLAERFGARVILAIGTLVAGIGYILAGFAGGFDKAQSAVSIPTVEDLAKRPTPATAAAIANTVKRVITTSESIFSIMQLIDLLFHYFEQCP